VLEHARRVLLVRWMCTRLSQALARTGHSLIVLGMNFRIYDSAKQVWSINWLNGLEGPGRTSRRSSSAEPGSTASPSPMPLRQSVGRSGPLRAQRIQIFPSRISLGAVRSLRTRKR
jgi:hypothetical protein